MLIVLYCLTNIWSLFFSRISWYVKEKIIFLTDNKFFIFQLDQFYNYKMLIFKLNKFLLVILLYTHTMLLSIIIYAE